MNINTPEVMSTAITSVVEKQTFEDAVEMSEILPGRQRMDRLRQGVCSLRLFVSGSERGVGRGSPAFIYYCYEGFIDLHVELGHLPVSVRGQCVETMRTFKSCLKEEASSTARHDDVEVLPQVTHPSTTHADSWMDRLLHN